MSRAVKTFDVTDLQNMYKLGENHDFILGGKSPIVYFSVKMTSFSISKFQNAVNKIVKRHSLLHSRINSENKWEECEIENTEIEYLSQYNSAEEENRKISEDMCSKKIDLQKTPLFKIKVLIEEKRLATAHFLFSGLVIDGWSVEVFLKELKAAYDDAPLPDTADYSEYVDYLNSYKNNSCFYNDNKFFKEIAENNPASEILLPFKTIPEKIKLPENSSVKMYIGDEVWLGVKKYCAEIGVTPFVMAMTVFSYVISRYSSSDNFFLNIPCGLRNPEIKNIENTIGLCSNFILFPVNICRTASLKENALLNQAQMLDMQDHIIYPGSEAVRAVQEISKIPLSAPVVFTDVLDFIYEESTALKKLDWRIHTNQVMIEADLVRLNGEPYLTINYIKNLFEENIIENMAELFVNTLKMLCGNSETAQLKSIPILKSDMNIIDLFNNTKTPVCQRSLNEILDESFCRYADETAVIYRNKEYKYKEIQRKAQIIQDILKNKKNFDKNSTAAIFLPKSAGQVISAAAVLLAGGAYMPVDTELPISQIQYCIKNVKADIVITNSSLISKFDFLNSEQIINIDDVDFSNYNCQLNFEKNGSHDTRIIINTSGSTGKPKSIMLKESSIVNCLINTWNIFGLNSKDKVLSVTNFCHDMAIFDTIGMFFFGGAVVIPDADKTKEPSHWIDLIQKYKVTIWNSVPAIMEMLLLQIGEFNCKYEISLKTVISGGEFLRPRLAEDIKKLLKNPRLFNVGGPSETTIWNIYHEVTDNDIKNNIIPYGRPFPNTEYYILNNNMEICPVGVKGTMYCMGSGVSKGYIGLEEENTKRFVKFNDGIAYNTGDLGRMLPCGEIEISGRADFQIKIRGKRIELSAIEKVLCEMDGIKSAIVIFINKSQKLAAFYIGNSDISQNEIITFMKNHLAEYMIPKQYFLMESFPVTPNGKPDRKLLEQIAQENNKICDKIKSNTDENSLFRRKILEILKDVLDDEYIDESMNFYMAGGDSISAVKASAKINSLFNIQVSVYDIINSVNIEEWLDEICESL